jgi:hypothetical protein
MNPYLHLLIILIFSAIVIQSHKDINWEPILFNGDCVLFIGNSKVGSEGGLHHHFRRTVARATPPIDIQTDWLAMYNRPTLKDMYTEEVTQRIKEGTDDVVIVSSGSEEAMHQFEKLIRESNKKMVLYGIWANNPLGDPDGWEGFKKNTQTISEEIQKFENENGLEGFRDQTIRIVENARQFEKETGVPIAPCGLVFYNLIVDPPKGYDLRLDWVYMVENIHQNHIGTMANAATYFAVLTGLSPVGLEMWDPYPKDLAREVQERAWKIVQDWKNGNVEIKPLPQ